MKIAAALRGFLRTLVPTTRITRLDYRHLPNEVASTLDVDRVGDYIRACTEGGDPSGLFALYRDMIATHAHLQGRFVERKEAVIGDPMALHPAKKGDRAAEDARAFIEAQIAALDGWEDAMVHLLDSGIYPVSVVEKVFRAEGNGFVLAELVPVPHDLLDFRAGHLQIRDTDERGMPLATSRDPDPARYIIHRGHLLTLPDQWGGPMRSIVFWFLLGMTDREWWGRYLDRYASPFFIGRYEDGDEDSRSVLHAAFSYAKRLGGLVVTKDTEIELQEAAAKDTGDAFEVFHRVANEEISKLITGQTLSSDAKATGMGSGVATQQGQSKSDKRQADARRLGNTLRTQLFRQLLQINGIDAEPPRATWGAVSTAEMSANAEVLEKIAKAGLQVGDAGLPVLSERFGMPIERQATPSPTDVTGSLVTHSVRLQNAHARAAQARVANDAVSRDAVARLVHQLRNDHAPVVRMAAESRSPDEFLAKLEAHCANLDTLAASEILEAALVAMAANGSVVSVR